MRPAQIISLMDLGPPTFILPDHYNHIHVGYTFTTAGSSIKQLGQILKPEQWQRLIQRLGQIQNPKVPAKPSAAALPAKGGSRPATSARPVPGIEIEQITIGADPAAWARAGFAIEGNASRAGTVGLQFASGEGILGWRLSSAAAERDRRAAAGSPGGPTSARRRVSPGRRHPDRSPSRPHA